MLFNKLIQQQQPSPNQTEAKQNLSCLLKYKQAERTCFGKKKIFTRLVQIF